MSADPALWPLTSLPPGAKDLPCDDGEPMDTPRHRQQMNLLISSLELAWRDRTDFFVGGNMFVYFSLAQTRKNDFRGPDVFVVLDTDRRERLSWVVWEEDGKTPDVVIELTSPITEVVDRGMKMGIYARQLGVSRYYVFDPFSGRLDGWALDNTPGWHYEPIAPLASGDIPCEPLGLRLGVRPGVHDGVEAPWLRWIDADGRVLPSEREAAERDARRAEAERQRAEAESSRAEAESRRAEAERSRADTLAAELAEYRSRYGGLG